MTVKLKILTPEKVVVERDVESVTLPGKAGQLTVLSGHDLLVAELSSGRLFFRWVNAEAIPQREDYDIGPGIAEILHDAAHVFVSAATRTEP